MKKLEKYAADNGIEFSISATGWTNAKDACDGVDCVLMGPQVAYQKANVEALGLHKVGSSNTFRDDAVVRGMIKKVSHLVKVEEI